MGAYGRGALRGLEGKHAGFETAQARFVAVEYAAHGSVRGVEELLNGADDDFLALATLLHLMAKPAEAFVGVHGE